MLKNSALLLALVLSGCAFQRPQNRPLTTALDGLVNPKTTAAKVALAPLVIPAGTASLLLDVFVLHPAQVVPDAVRDTREDIWKDSSGTYVTKAFLFVPKVAVTPIYFGVVWLFYSMCDDHWMDGLEGME